MKKLHEQSDLNVLLTPHVGSITIEYDPLVISQARILERVHQIESSLEASVDLSIPCRELRLPLVLDHPEIQNCVQRYMETVRDKAVYLPDNLEYLAKCNGLQSRRDVFQAMLDTSYVVAAVGFLCGAPILFPLEPRTIMGQKYNPTRVSTPGGTFGIGGSIISGYSIEQPGGYMMLARTLEMWDSFGTKPGFTANKPWLFEIFDRVSFYEVDVEEYNRLSQMFAAGAYRWDISESTFNVREAYDMFQGAKTDPAVIEYKRNQKQAMEEQQRLEIELYTSWKSQTTSVELPDEGYNGSSEGAQANDVTVTSPMVANIWKILVQPGDILRDNQVVAVLEAMKMEVNVHAPRGSEGFRVQEVLKRPKSIANVGDVILVARPIT